MSRGLGMVLFLREGMKAWMEGWRNTAMTDAPRPPSSLGTSIDVPQGVRNEAILVLTEMVMRVQPEVN
jgi:hypothetical protein